MPHVPASCKSGESARDEARTQGSSQRPDLLSRPFFACRGRLKIHLALQPGRCDAHVIVRILQHAEDGGGVEGGSATSSVVGTQIVRHAEPLRWREATWKRSHREGAKGGGSLDHGERSGDLQLSLSERVAQVRSPDERASVAGGCAPRDLAHAEKQAWMGLKGAGTRLSWLRRRIDTSKSSALWRRRAPRERSEESR